MRDGARPREPTDEEVATEMLREVGEAAEDTRLPPRPQRTELVLRTSRYLRCASWQRLRHHVTLPQTGSAMKQSKKKKTSLRKEAEGPEVGRGRLEVCRSCLNREQPIHEP